MIIIFSDLDGTLLDFESYSYDKAEEAIAEIHSRRIPVILASSKTRAEMEPIRARLGFHHPFIVENGAAVFMPAKLFNLAPPGAVSKDSYLVREFGRPYAEIISVFRMLKLKFNLPVTGLHEMSPSRISALTGLAEEDALLALEREYSEPFSAGGEFNPAIIEGALLGTCLHLTRGGRFYHLSGPGDKGAAVRYLITLYKSSMPESKSRIRSIGLGDSPNDLEMLRAVDYPFAVRKPGGTVDSVLREAGIPATTGIGPEGWNEAVLGMLELQV